METIESQLNILFKITKDIIIFIGADGDVIDVNSAAIATYGYTKEEFTTKNISDLRSYNDISLIQSQMKKAMDEGIYFETLHKRKDGSVFPVEVSSAGTILNGKVMICTIVRDITERKKAEAMLMESEERYRMLFENASEIIYTHDMNGIIISANKSFEKVLGYKREQLLGTNVEQILSPEYISVMPILQDKELCNNFCVTNLEVGLIDASGKKLMVEISKNILYKDGEPYEVQVIARDISERKAAEEQIKYLTYHDKLTNIYNRLFLEKELNTLIVENKVPVSIIILDVNGLKLANDAFGHLAGDDLLIAVGKILKASSQDNSIVARWGGDEFIIVTPFASEDQTKEIIGKIIDKCEESSADPIKPSVSIGYATLESGNQNIKEVFNEAENMMYTNKLLESRSLRSSIISSLQKTLHESTPETSEHCQRMKSMAIKFGRTIGLHKGELDKLALLALLHDIGKITIPKSILRKPDKLTEEEWETMKRHSQSGYNIANSTPDLSKISELILSHHERWDGRGYPQGLKGEEIPLLSRIISIIDAYDVMLNERPYKKPLSKEVTISELEKNAGLQFDPHLVKIFINMVS